MGQAISEVIRERGTSVPKVAKAAGMSTSTLYRIVRGDTASVKDRDLVRLAEELDVPLQRLTGQPGVQDSPDTTDVIRIPVVDQEVSASLRGGAVVEYVYLPKDDVPDHRRRDTLAVHVRGNCLSPDIVDGDTVIVDLSVAPESGNPVIATVDGNLHVKRLRVLRSGTWRLSSNEGEMDVEPWQIDGVVIGLYRGMGGRLRR